MAKRHSSAFTERAANGQPYDLVCMDIGLPNTDGRDVLRSLRASEEALGVQLGQGCPVFMTTGATDGKNIMKSFFGGCQAHLTKPMSREKLCDELAKVDLLGSHRAST